MNPCVKVSAIALLGVVCAACSKSNAPAPAIPAAAVPGSAAQPAASAIPMQAPAAGSSSGMPAPPPLSNGPSLAVILQRPGFAQAFADMDGASALPAWAKGGSATPSARVQVAGKTLWLSHVCEAADCQGGQLFLLTDPALHAMQGLLVEASAGAGDSVRRLVWLGKPDAAAQSFLKARLAARG